MTATCHFVVFLNFFIFLYTYFIYFSNYFCWIEPIISINEQLLWINDCSLIWYIYSYDSLLFMQIFVLTKLICFLYGLHVVSINRTLPINNNIQMSCSLIFILYCFFSSLLSIIISSLYALFYNTLSARCSNQLRTRWKLFLFNDSTLCVSIQALSNSFTIYNFTLYSCDKNCLTLSIFIFILLFIFIMTVIIINIVILMIIITINIIILCVSSKHAKRCKIWICDLWYCKEEFLILDFKFWNTFRCNG